MNRIGSIIIILLTMWLSIPGFAAQNIPLETELTLIKPVASIYVLEGVVEATLASTISAQTAGTIKTIHYDVDDVVEKNAVVLEIDNKQQASALRQAQATEKEASARLQEVTSEFRRAEKIYQDKVISKSDFDKIRAAFKSAGARLEAVQAATAAAQEQLDYTRVRAPFSGILTKRMVQTGEAVNVGSQLVSGVSLERLRVKTHVPQSIAKSVRQQPRVIVITEGSEIVSTDMTFFPFADSRSHSFELRINLPAQHDDLLPGMFVKVAIEVDQREQLVVPFNAVAFRGEVTGLYVQQQGVLQFRHIQLGKRLSNNEVVVLSGVGAGEQIVIDPVAAAIAIKQETTQE